MALLSVALLGVAVLSVTPAAASERVGDIEFFGHKGLNTAELREAIPVHEGDEYSEGTEDLVRQAVVRAMGKEPTDVAAVCCDDEGNRLFFIGLPGANYQRFTYDAGPTGSERLPAEIIRLHERLDQALEAAVRKGGDAAREDDSKGYALVNDPDARSLQLELREWAVGHEKELMQVLASSSDTGHRRVASNALGYARQSGKQLLALAFAARDIDSEVRNNATRALGVLVRSNAELAAQIPPQTFIEMLNSGIWSDRNKGAALLMEMTAGRDPDLLATIRAQALDSLVEMASWRRSGHSFFARIILGRIAGLPEEELIELAWQGPVESIIDAVKHL